MVSNRIHGLECSQQEQKFCSFLKHNVQSGRGSTPREGVELTAGDLRAGGAFVGLAVYFQDSALAMVIVVMARSGSLLVRYTRARGESLGIICKVGIMQRAERLLLVGFGGVLDPALAAWTGLLGGTPLLVLLAVVSVGTLGTAAYRTVWIANRLD